MGIAFAVATTHLRRDHRRWALEIDLVQDRSEPEPNLAEVPIELSGSLEECVDWGKRILKDRRLYVALVDVAAAWSPTSTPAKISEFLGGVALPALPVADALPADSGPLQLPVRQGGYLGLANRLEELVLSGVPLDDSAKTVLGEFILKAPLDAGTWGPFKGIIKALEPRAVGLPTPSALRWPGLRACPVPTRCPLMRLCR